MASRGIKASKGLESEIEKCRVDANWKRLIEIVSNINARLPGLEMVANFYIGESKLEQYLEENAPSEQNATKARSALSEAKRYLTSAFTSLGKADCSQWAGLLLGKLHYIMGMYEEGISNLAKADIDNINTDGLNIRTLKIIAEAHAVRGLCLEKLPLHSASKFKVVKHEEKIINSFERSAEIALLYLQECDAFDHGSNQPLSVAIPERSPTMVLSEKVRVGPILETAIQRAPILHIKNGELHKAVCHYRRILRAVESSSTQALRQTLARQLAEVLMRGICSKSYFPPDGDESESTVMSVALKPRRYSGQNLFTPHNENEETLLLLMISEAMATREAVLSRLPEHTEARMHAFNNASAIYDLLTIALVPNSQVGLLIESFERAMKFSFEEFHIWFQFALSLISSGQHKRALLVLKECMRIQPNNPLPALQAIQLCYNHLSLPEEGIELSENIIQCCEKQEKLKTRAYVALGIGYSIKADEAKLQKDRQELHRKALKAFYMAQSEDPLDYLAEFNIALQHALTRQIVPAYKHVHQALLLRSEHIHSLHLLALLLSSQKRYEEALQLIEATLEEYPNNLNLLFTKVKLEERCRGIDDALLTNKHMLKLWKELYEDELHGEGRVTSRVGSDGRSMLQLHQSELSDRDSGSMYANSIAASRVEQALSEVASSMNSYQPRQGPQQTWMLIIQIWLQLAELYLKQDQPSEAYNCVQEASNAFPLSHLVLYMRGRIHEHKNEFTEAKQFYEHALAINPWHIYSLRHLGVIHLYLGNNSLAEKLLRDAVNIDPTSHDSWFTMGKILETIGEFEAASDCLMTAIDLERTSPIVSFATIPRYL